MSVAEWGHYAIGCHPWLSDSPHMDVSVFVHLPGSGRLGWSLFLAINEGASVNIRVQGFVCTQVLHFPGIKPGGALLGLSGILFSGGTAGLSSTRGCTILHSRQQWMKVPISPRLVLTDTWTSAILTAVTGISLVLICIFIKNSGD